MVRILGLVMAVLFSAAAAFLGLKVGQVFEAAIPIAIIAVGLSSGFKRKTRWRKKKSLSSPSRGKQRRDRGRRHIYAARPLHLAGQVSRDHDQFLRSIHEFALGRHPRYPAPDPVPEVFRIDHARQISIPGSDCHHTGIGVRREGGNQAKPLIYAGLVGGLYDFIIATFGWWIETVSTRIVGVGEMLADKAKVVFKVNTGAAVLQFGLYRIEIFGHYLYRLIPSMVGNHPVDVCHFRLRSTDIRQ